MKHPDHEESIAAQAAAWIARLQGQQASSTTKAAFRAWFDEDEAHRAAFETATEIWEILPGAAMLADPPQPHPRPQRRIAATITALAAAILAMIAVGIGFGWLSQEQPVYATATGRQESVILPDGSRIDLNSDSQVTLLYSKAERHVRLDRGEVMFHVRKDAQRPFTVASADDRVRALGTTFVVRRFPRATTVTLASGRVEIARAEGSRSVRLGVLEPGERATLTRTAAMMVDRPPIDILTAWRNREVIFEDASLVDAALEMNRYAASKSLVVDPALARLRISGIFGIDELEQFAISAAALHQLRLERRGGEIRLAPIAAEAAPHHTI